MSTFRNKILRAAVLLILPLLATVVSAPRAGGEQKKQAEKPTISQSIDQKKIKSKDRIRPDRKFIPSVKVSAGKPVSFPTDI